MAIKPLKNRLISFITLLALALFAIPQVWAAVSIDRTVSGDGTTASTTVSTPPISTSSTNELLLAFVSTDYHGFRHCGRRKLVHVPAGKNHEGR